MTRDILVYQNKDDLEMRCEALYMQSSCGLQEKALKQQEMNRKIQKEQAEKERLRREQEKQK